MRGADAPTRDIAVHFSRTLGATGEQVAYPAVSPERARFVSAFERVNLAQYRKALLHVWPYATVTHDRLEGDQRHKAGVDLLWKPSPTFQLGATVNPDFGQVESDDLVISFDAVETFQSDRRPFFTENQSIFKQTTPDAGRLVHTRRIGAEADDGTGMADIAAAIKLNGSLGALGQQCSVRQARERACSTPYRPESTSAGSAPMSAVPSCSARPACTRSI